MLLVSSQTSNDISPKQGLALLRSQPARPDFIGPSTDGSELADGNENTFDLTLVIINHEWLKTKIKS